MLDTWFGPHPCLGTAAVATVYSAAVAPFRRSDETTAVVRICRDLPVPAPTIAGSEQSEVAVVVRILDGEFIREATAHGMGHTSLVVTLRELPCAKR